MLSNEVISTLNEAAEHHVAYPNSPIYIVKRNGARGSKFFTVLPIAKDHIVLHSYSWLVYMSEDEDFQTNNEATEYVKHRIEAIRSDNEMKSKLMKNALLNKLTDEDRCYIDRRIVNMRNNVNYVEQYRMYAAELRGYLQGLVNFGRITEEESYLLSTNLTSE